MAFWISLLSFLGCNNKKTSKSNNDSEVVLMDPNDLLMSIATIENTLPKTNNQKTDSLDLEILEDDWRQLEFILKKHSDLITQEIDSINKIIENESVKIDDQIVGFKNLHVRKLIPNPLDEGINLVEFKNEFSSLKIGSLSFNRYGKVNKGIYFNISNFDLYGITENSKVKTLAFQGLSSWDELSTFKLEIKRLMSKYNLVLVDWKSREVIDFNKIDLYLTPNE